MNDFIEINRIVSIVLRRWWILAIMTAITATAAFVYSRRQVPVYEASATLLVGQITESSNLSREDIQMSSEFARTYADLAVRQPVLQGVVEMLKLRGTWQDLKERVDVSAIDGTQMIEIRAEASTPEMAEKIADEVAEHLILVGPSNVQNDDASIAASFLHKQMEETKALILEGQERIKEIEAELKGDLTSSKMLDLQTEKADLERLVADNVTNYVELSNLSAQERKPNSLSVIESAHAEPDPIRPKVNLNILLGGGLGILLALGIIFLWEFMDDSIKSVDDLSQFMQLNVIGTIGRIKSRTDAEKIITHLEPSSPTAESYRMIRNKIRFGAIQEAQKAYVVTSPEPDEGKSMTAANLGVIMAQANLKTVLIDSDLRNPVLHKMFRVKQKIGLADLMADPEMPVDECLKNTNTRNLQIITSGDVSPEQTEMLQSERMTEILQSIKEMVDIVIIDSPPVLLSADTAILSNKADGVIMVIRAGKSKRKAIKQSLRDLQEANAKLLGCIYNEPNRETTIAKYPGQKRRKTIQLRKPF